MHIVTNHAKKILLYSQNLASRISHSGNVGLPSNLIYEQKFINKLFHNNKDQMKEMLDNIKISDVMMNRYQAFLNKLFFEMV